MIYKIGQVYKDILSVSRDKDQFVSWFSTKGSGIGNSGGIRAARYVNGLLSVPCYLVLITRNTSHHRYNPWEDIVDYSSGLIYYWGDAKFSNDKSYSDYRGNRYLLKSFEKVLENRLSVVPPILHFSKFKPGAVRFNGLCALTKLDLTWFEDRGNPVKNFKCELTILDTDKVGVDWLHDRAKCTDLRKLNKKAPKVWKEYIAGNTKILDVWSKSILTKEDQLPPENSKDSKLLDGLTGISPIHFEAIVVELLRNLPQINHKIFRTQPTADGGFDFYGQFSLPYPISYTIKFLGEAKKYGRNTAVQPRHVSRLVARLDRGQFGIFITTSYYTRQTQKEVLKDGYPVKLFSGKDIVNILKELRLANNGEINQKWLASISEDF